MAIAEFPYLRIDDFRDHEDSPSPELCILSHMHEDHTVGLARKSYHGPYVYCTAATKAMLLRFRSNFGAGPLKYNHLRKEIGGKEILQVLELGKPYSLEYPSGSLQVTLIDANHCPGAAMVLVQAAHNKGPAVLFTGDIRCERWHLNSLQHNPVLFPFCKDVCDGPQPKLLSLYVDDTYLSHRDPFKGYSDNYDGIRDLVTVLKDYPAEVHFCLADRTTGHEEVLIALAHQLHTKVHMDQYYFALYKSAAATSTLAAKLLECSTVEFEAGLATRLHYCHKHNGCPMRDAHAPTAYFKPCNQPPIEEINLQNLRLPFETIVSSTLEPFEKSDTLFVGPDQRYYKDLRTQRFYPLFPWFYFSRHSSFPELQALRDLFHVTTVRSLRGAKLPSLDLAPGASSKKMDIMASKTSPAVVAAPGSGAGAGAVDGVTTLAQPREPASPDGMLPVYKKQDHARSKKRHRRRRRNSNDTETDSDESERHKVLELLNRRSLREASKQKWRSSILEREKHRSSQLDTQEADELEFVQMSGAAFELETHACDDDALAMIAGSDGPEEGQVEHEVKVKEDVDDEGHDDADCSSLLSPPLSPNDGASAKNSAHASCAASSCTDCKVPIESQGDFWESVDETPTSETLLAALELQIRNDPGCWFSFAFDFAG